MTSRQDETAILQFQCTKLWINLRKKLETATGIRPYKPVANINFGIDWESLSDEEVPNSGGYACVYCTL